MTPQLRQAIKLLQFSNLEVNAFVEEEMERNPLLERDEAPDAPIGERAALDQIEPRAAASRMRRRRFGRARKRCRRRPRSARCRSFEHL